MGKITNTIKHQGSDPNTKPKQRSFGEARSADPMEKEFIRLLTDFGFKRVFGSRKRTGILKRFLNALFEGEMRITTVTFQEKELMPEHEEGKKIIYDIYCTTDTDEHFILEMQQVETENFPDRILFYVSRAIVDQVAKGQNYLIAPVYCIVITDFNLSTMSPSLKKDIVLTDRYSNEVYTDKERVIFVSLKEVPDEWEKCETELLRLLYLIKNMEKLSKESKSYQSGEYDEIFTASATGSLTNEEAEAYSQSYFREIDQRSAISFAEKQGMEQGMEQGELLMLTKNVESMRSYGVTDTEIARLLNQPLEVISSIK